MSRDNDSTALVLAIVLVSLLGIALAIWSLTAQRSMWGMMGSGMMGGSAQADPGPGGAEWGILLASATFFVAAVAMLFRATRTMPHATAFAPASPSAAIAPPSVAAAPATAMPEVALMKLLDEDERRMYLEVRDHGGAMLQRDLVRLGTLSKAKVTRVLDKLERRGVVVRERHGMTNRVRIVAKAAR